MCTFTMATHFTMLRPSPDKAPHLPATVCDIHKENKNPIQLNKNDTENKQKYTSEIKIYNTSAGDHVNFVYDNVVSQQMVLPIFSIYL